jgi:hypothetical protein
MEALGYQRHYRCLRNSAVFAADEDGYGRPQLAHKPNDPGDLGSAIHSRPLRHRLPGVDFPYLARLVLRASAQEPASDGTIGQRPDREAPGPQHCCVSV